MKLKQISLHTLFKIYFIYLNKFFTTNFIFYCLILNIFLLFFIFLSIYNNFFKIILNICFLFNISIFLSYMNGDFFSAFLLMAELPIAMVLIIFYFHKNSLQIDSLYKIQNKNYNYTATILISLFIYLNIYKNNLFVNYDFYETNLYNLYSTLIKNDFFIIFNISYQLNYIYIVFFAVLIFFISFLVILFYQINKLQLLINESNKKNIIFLRKQNMLKQAVFKSRLKFFNKK